MDKPATSVLASTIPDTAGEITCAGCGATLARRLDRHGKLWLLAAGLRLRAAHGNCHVCGRRFHFTQKGSDNG